MAKKELVKYSKNFGAKEKVLNYACQTYQLSRPNKVGSVMELIRTCQPATIQEWEDWYFANAQTEGKNKLKISKKDLEELGTRLHEKITQVVIPEWEAAFKALSLQDCIDYIHNLTINRTYDGYITEKSVVHDNLAKIFPQITFEESPAELDHAGDVDYVGYITDEVAFGIQIKPTTAKANFGNYSPSERMRANFESFKNDFGGRVFIIYSEKGEVSNSDVIKEIEQEILRLQAL